MFKINPENSYGNNLDEFVLSVLHQSNDYLRANPEISEQLRETLLVYQSLTDLPPITGDNVFSGHLFPQVEAETELEDSIALCKLGFYKHAIGALRHLLELGLLSVYWDIDGKSHHEIQGWLKSDEPTPFKTKILKRLRTHPNIQRFDKTHELFADTSRLFDRLNDFTHTRGIQHSTRRLKKSNVNTFNDQALLEWLDLLTGVVGIIATFHLLVYPIGLQYTPLDDKFGLNPPAGGFLQPIQMDRLKRFLDKRWLETLQEISDSCPDIQSLVNWVNERPNITEEEFSAQVEQFDKDMKDFQKMEKPKTGL